MNDESFVTAHLMSERVDELNAEVELLQAEVKRLSERIKEARDIFSLFSLAVVEEYRIRCPTCDSFYEPHHKDCDTGRWMERSES